MGFARLFNIKSLEETDKMALFEGTLKAVGEKFGLSDQSASKLIAGILGLITSSGSAGFSGFLDKFRNAGFGSAVDSWLAGGESQTLSADDVRSALGPDTVASLAGKAGLDEKTAAAALGGIVPGVVDTLTPDGQVPDNESLLSRVGGFLSEWGGTIGGAVAGGAAAASAYAGNAADKVGGSLRDARAGLGDAVDSASGGSGSVLRWLVPLLLVALVVGLGFWFCQRGQTPVANTSVNANANRAVNANANANKAAVESSFRITATDGKYSVTGVVPDQKTLDDIKAKLDAQFGAGNVDYSGIKIDATAKPFAANWWTNFQQMLPNLKDWKTGSLAFAGGAVTEAVGLPAAVLDQLKSLFSGWTLPSSLSAGAAEAPKTLAEVSLPDGTKLQAYPGGIEDQLVKFIGSDEYKNGTADTLKDKWFSFDDLNFVFGKTELTPESKRQLDNITAILKAFPDVKMKIGAYTDKKGDDAANKKLSDERAKAVQAALVKAGVGAQVPEAEGYGEEFAKVEESASDEARKVDRKTAIRLIK